MDISSIASLLSQSYGGVSGQASQSSRTSGTDQVAAAFEKAESRVTKQLESTKVQLSAYGQIKAAFADVQTASKALTDPKQTATVEDVKKVAGSFVDAYNKANKAVSVATQNAGKEVGALANDARARIAGSDLRRSVAEGNSLADLKKVGITQNKDGSLAIDTKALESAFQANPEQVRSTLASVGTQVDNTATRELAKSGNVGSSVTALSNRSRNLEAQQSTQQGLAAAAQRQIDQQTARLNPDNAFASGVAAYLRTFIG